ncbi:hypothetical protein [Rhizobacter sp. OV335]|uniref:hypothetical protein n=1 Tax=Rhizobacter sp. OV335 TaxID=1500264 RepID=UPI00091DB717|nr:hypothetical protein [Rhizobacter sp. OV335]SHN01517.1 hypothetical protein SAMN02787076_02914 [Rhizobacter sp. OV335]
MHRLTRGLLALMLCLCFDTAHADAFFKLVGYQCDRKADRLVLTYDAVANGAGQRMLAAKTDQQWDPWSLVHAAGESQIGSMTTVQRTCALSDGLYAIELGPVPGNMNTEGRCGAWMSAWAEVRRGTRIIYPHADFESGVGCFYADGMITTRVEIAPRRNRHRVTRHPAEELLSDTSDMR